MTSPARGRIRNCVGSPPTKIKISTDRTEFLLQFINPFCKLHTYRKIPDEDRWNKAQQLSQQTFHDINLAGPCGFYCGTCRHYLARIKGLLKEKNLKHGCQGCRIQNKNCAWVKKDCVLIRKNHITFCFECEDFPCANLRKLDARHVRDDNVSLIDNLRRIKKIGTEPWLEEQEEEWRCSQCGGNICVMDGECYDCGYKIG